MEMTLQNAQQEKPLQELQRGFRLKLVQQRFEIGKSQEEKLQSERLIEELAETNRELNKVLHTLKDSELLFREFFESAPEAIGIVDVDTRKFVDFNSNLLKMFKYPAEEMLQKGPADICPVLQPDGQVSASGVIEMIGQLMQGKKPIFEWTHIDSEGRQFPCEVRLTKLSVPGRNLIRGSMIDISEKKLTEESLRQSEANLQTIFKNTEVGFLLMDACFNVVDFNDIISQWTIETLGTSLSKGIQMRDIILPEKLSLFDSVMEMIIQQGQVDYEMEHPEIDGATKWVHVNGKPVTDENKTLIGICLSVNDITLRKKAEGEIKELNESLEEKVKERTAELESVNKELESFSYSISHDLRAPLRIINGFANLLLKRNADKMDKDGIDYLEIIMTNAKNMGQLIDDLLNFSHLSSATLTKDNVNMDTMVKEIVNELKSAEPNIAAEIHIDTLQLAECDYNLIRQVWVNLVSNAVKYSRKKEKPLVEIGTLLENGQLTYYVKDNGAGFDMNHYDKLFSVFQRLHKVTEYEGTGVGLALTQRIINRHGGKIWAEAKVNEGATFYFTLPVAHAALS